MKVCVYLSDEKLQPQVRDLFMLFFDKREINYIYQGEPMDSPYIFRVKVTDKLYFYAAFHANAIEKTEELLHPEFPKWQIRKLVYQALCTFTGKRSDWGLLTGIRPTKVIQRAIKEGRPEEEIYKELTEFYELSPQKARLTIDIARREYRYTEALEEKEASLYVGIPYCPSICEYCSFSSYLYDKAGDQVDRYLDALEKDMCATAEMLKGKTLGTVYIGGGTPTSLNEQQLARLMEMINRHFDLSHVREFTCEAGRPDTINANKLRILKAGRVDRISVNPQTLHDETLERIGRRHTVSDFLEALSLANEVGFRTINADLIAGLEGEKREDILYSVKTLVDLGVNSITIHSLAIKRAANLSTNTVENIDREFIAGTLCEAADILGRSGYEPYYMYRQKNIAGNQENVGYCKIGHECLYNVYMIADCQSIYAVGAGGISKIKSGEGHTNIIGTKAPYRYIENINGILEKKTSNDLTTLI